MDSILARNYAFVVVSLRYLIVGGWAAAVVLAILLLPPPSTTSAGGLSAGGTVRPARHVAGQPPRPPRPGGASRPHD